jgi:hypothetical protein
MISSTKTTNWKEFFIKSKRFDYLDENLMQLRESIDPNAEFLEEFEEISKNPGVCFLALDPSETKLSLFHHPSVVGGSWKKPKTMIGFINFEFNANPVEIVSKSIKEIKGKSHSLHEFGLCFGSTDDFKHLRNPKTNFHHKNILPIPSVLTKTFLELPSTEPDQVAIAFYDTLYQCDIEAQYAHNQKDKLSDDSSSIQDQEPNNKASNDGLIQKQTDSINNDNKFTPKFLENCLHIIQFCHLCSIGKVNPVLFTPAQYQEARDWRLSILASANIKDTPNSLALKHRNPDPSPDDNQEHSPANKLSRRDEVFINTMLKIHESVDKSLLQSASEKDEKEPGFKKLEPHRKNFILNTSAPPPFDLAAEEPTKFYSQFLAKKSQFKAKEMPIHRLTIDDIAFNPNTTFISCLWNCEFLWILPHTPSGISIFFCPETKSLNAKDGMLSMADKVKQSDIEKLSKQKTTFPTCLMDLVWMTQNLHAVVKLCFGPKSLSATFMSEWASHM